MSPSSEAPTPRQLHHLRALADRSGTTFTYPSTRAQASREIDRLSRLPREPRDSRRRDHVEEDRVAYATAVQVDEVAGFGSGATWRVSPAPSARRRKPMAASAVRRLVGRSMGMSSATRTGPDHPAAPGLLNAGKPRFPARALARRPPRRSNGTVGLDALPRDAETRSLLAARVDCLGAYPASEDRGQRHVVALTRPDASVLVLDCLAGTLRDALLVAQLAADEPHGNARLLARMYIADPTRGRCAPLAALQLDAPKPSGARPAAQAVPESSALLDARGRTYAIREMSLRGLGFELRWTRSAREDRGGPLFEPVTVRDVVGALEAYDPAVAITSRALALPDAGGCVSTARLRAELRRLQDSRIVLNRGLREAVQRQVGAGSSMSQIAMRCGRVKRDARGNESGETSWLGRRLGLLAEGGKSAPTPWVHSDVLALIARRGLGVAPHEVEI